MANIVKKFVVGIPVTKSGNTEEYEKAIEWYVNVLGFELVWKMGIASLKLDNGQEIGLFGEEDDENSFWFTGDIKRNPHYSSEKAQRQFRTFSSRAAAVFRFSDNHFRRYRMIAA